MYAKARRSPTRCSGESQRKEGKAGEACTRFRICPRCRRRGAKRPKMKSAEEADIEEFGEFLTRTVGEEQVNLLAAVDVHVSEAGIRNAKEKTPDPRNLLSDLTMIVSTYHLVGYYMQSPVYKAAQPDDTSPEVYLFYFGGNGEQGWYISTKWFYTLAQKKLFGCAGLIKA